jgi:arylsulfatase A-like enzyme
MILDRIRQHGLEENTLVIFTSDNGPGEMSKRQFQSSGPFRGVKRDLYEGGIRVPFLASWKGVVAPGVTCQPITFWDLLPSVCDLLGTPSPRGVDGVTLLPTLLGKPGDQRPHEYFYWEFFERGFQQAVREGDWKGIRLKQGEPLELYNLVSDPQESSNVAAANPRVIAQLEARLRTCRTRTAKWG